MSRSLRAQAAAGWIALGLFLALPMVVGFVAGCTFKALVP